MRRKNGAYYVALCGVLLGTMLILGFVESLLPIPAPMPGIKLGLSNSLLIFAVYSLNVPTSFLLMALKVLLSGLLFGGVSSMMYGFSGGVLSVVTMVILHRVKGIHPVVVSMAGGAMHNVGQVLLAMIILKTPMLVYYMAVLIVVGMVCGALTGVCAAGVMKHLGKGHFFTR